MFGASDMQGIDKQAVLDEFDEQGFVVMEGLLDPEEDIQPVVDEYADLLDWLSKEWHEQGKLTDTFEDLPVRGAADRGGKGIGGRVLQLLRHLAPPELHRARHPHAHRAEGLRASQERAVAGRGRDVHWAGDLLQPRPTHTY